MIYFFSEEYGNDSQLPPFSWANPCKPAMFWMP